MKTNPKLFYVWVTLMALFIIVPMGSFLIFTGTDNEKKVEDEIMQLIKNESDAWWNKDFDRWSDCWVQADYIRTMGWWKEGGITIVKGWSERGERTRELMANNPEQSPQKTSRKDWNIRVTKDMAWVTFTQYGENTSQGRMEMPGISYETRILEKHDGKWKIAYVGWLLEE